MRERPVRWNRLVQRPVSVGLSFQRAKAQLLDKGVVMRSISNMCLLLALIMLSGCISFPPVKMEGLDAKTGAFVIDRTKPDSYPGFGLAQGNIYSCRAGIQHIGQKNLIPPKAIMFGALLSREKPEIVYHQVVLEQFDVYRNYRLRSLSGTRAMGGAIFTAVAGAADRKNNKELGLERFAIRSDPGDGRWKPDENQVGCDGRGEGEYYASEVNGGSDVIVIWLQFSIDDKPYSFRSAYQYHYDEAASLTGEDKIKEAIEMTITSIASKIVF